MTTLIGCGRDYLRGVVAVINKRELLFTFTQLSVMKERRHS